jgi:GxxExxY protein
MKITKKYLTQLGYEIVGAAIEVHKQLGPGLLESIYEECLAYELQLRGFDAKRQVKVPVFYKGKKVKDDLSIDILVENCIIVETKSVQEFHPVFESQLLTYMKLSEIPKGFLINFNVTNITKEGLKPFVNELFEELEDE